MLQNALKNNTGINQHREKQDKTTKIGKITLEKILKTNMCFRYEDVLRNDLITVKVLASLISPGKEIQSLRAWPNW